MHPCLRRPRVGGLLQRHRATHQRIGEIDRNVGDALERRRGRDGRRDLDANRIRQPRLEGTCVAQCTVAHGFGSINVESRKAQERPEHTQNFPRRPRLAAGIDDRVEALHTSFAIDERAGRFGEGRDGEQHVGVGRPVLERAHHDNEFRLLQRGTRNDWICTIEFGFRVQQQIRATRVGEHRLQLVNALFFTRKWIELRLLVWKIPVLLKRHAAILECQRVARRQLVNVAKDRQRIGHIPER